MPNRQLDFMLFLSNVLQARNLLFVNFVRGLSRQRPDFGSMKRVTPVLHPPPAEPSSVPSVTSLSKVIANLLVSIDKICLIWRRKVRFTVKSSIMNLAFHDKLNSLVRLVQLAWWLAYSPLDTNWCDQKQFKVSVGLRSFSSSFTRDCYSKIKQVQTLAFLNSLFYD